MSHHCHARGCPVEVPPRLLMCKRHWRLVPKALKDQVWATYRPGQEVDKQPSKSYLEAAKQAIRAVQAKELKSRGRRRRRLEAAQGELFGRAPRGGTA